MTDSREKARASLLHAAADFVDAILAVTWPDKTDLQVPHPESDAAFNPDDEIVLAPAGVATVTAPEVVESIEFSPPGACKKNANIDETGKISATDKSPEKKAGLISVAGTADQSDRLAALVEKVSSEPVRTDRLPDNLPKPQGLPPKVPVSELTALPPKETIETFGKAARSAAVAHKIKEETLFREAHGIPPVSPTPEAVRAAIEAQDDLF